jgi:O-methyltransferase domain
MGPETLLLIGELILDPDPVRGPPTGYLHDMQMMAMFGSARERTEAEFRDLLAEAGFALRRAIPTASPISILEAVAA